MIKKSIEETYFTVVEFHDRNGKMGKKLKPDTTIIMATSDKGLSLPFSRKRLGSKIKLGDRFKETIKISPENIAKKSCK